MANPYATNPMAAGQPRPQLLYGTVSTPAPTGFNSPLYVSEPHRPEYFRQVLSWPACHGSTLPVAGNPVLLVQDNYNHLWCVMWASSFTSFGYGFSRFIQ